MAWTAPFTAVTGNVILASDWNTYGRDNLNYLKGVGGGQILLEGPVAFENDANFFADLIAAATPGITFDSGDDFRFSRASNFFQFVITSSERARADVSGLHSSDGTTLMRVQRHPFANNRHMESGATAGSASAGVSVTFTNAYSSGQRVVGAVEHASVSRIFMLDASPSTTGFTFSCRDLASGRTTDVANWMAEGID